MTNKIRVTRRDGKWTVETIRSLGDPEPRQAVEVEDAHAYLLNKASESAKASPLHLRPSKAVDPK